MAERLFHRRRNPEVLGLEMIDVAWVTGGVAFTGVANDKVVAPLIDRLVPTLKNNHLVRKLVDGGTTLGVAWAGAQLVKLIDGGAATFWQLGGSALGLAKGVTAFVPQFQFSATTPIDNTVSKYYNRIFGAQGQGSGQAAPSLGAAGATGLPAGGPQTQVPDVTGTLALNSGLSQDTLNLTAVGGTAYALKGGA